MSRLIVQRMYKSKGQPSVGQIQAWVKAALQEYPKDTEIVVRIVAEVESAELNQHYRQKAGATNVLSFPANLTPSLGLNWLGDLVVCAPIIEQEANDQGKLLLHHWAHIIVHGVLHLLGYDHQNDEDAERMEALEIDILKTLTIPNPYLETTQS